MKFVTLAFATSFALLALDAKAEKFNKEAAVDEAKSITKAFGGALKKELMAAMQSGGPMNALEVCNVEAMPITTQVAQEQNADVYRVSLKNRNSENLPNDWQTNVLKDFNTRADKGEDIATMASVEILEVGDKKQMRFMKAVPTEGACLACHGTQIGSELQAKIDELYPDDKATGYSLGEVRGAIVVVKDYVK